MKVQRLQCQVFQLCLHMRPILFTNLDRVIFSIHGSLQYSACEACSVGATTKKAFTRGWCLEVGIAQELSVFTDHIISCSQERRAEGKGDDEFHYDDCFGRSRGRWNRFFCRMMFVWMIQRNYELMNMDNTPAMNYIKVCDFLLESTWKEGNLLAQSKARERNTIVQVTYSEKIWVKIKMPFTDVQRTLQGKMQSKKTITWSSCCFLALYFYVGTISYIA